jgi:serine/threonine-protein kinase PpkA
MGLPSIEIANFRLIKAIGQGGMGTVYLAEQQNPSRPAAIKIITPELGLPKALLEALKNEGDIVANFRHPHLVTVFECGIVDGHYYLAMEYLPGGDLEERLDGPMDQDEALRIIRSIIDALGHIHARGFVHRDLKPANILFDEEGRAVLADFGIAKLADTDGLMTQLGYATGTPSFMSPEQILNKAVDGRSDLYSLGIVFYQMLTGELPFRQDSEFELKQAQVNEPPPKLPRHLRHFQVVLDRLLAKEPDSRFDDARKLLRALDFRSQATGEYEAPTANTSAPGQEPRNIEAIASSNSSATWSRIRVIRVVTVAIVAIIAALVMIGYW